MRLRAPAFTAGAGRVLDQRPSHVVEHTLAVTHSGIVLNRLTERDQAWLHRLRLSHRGPTLPRRTRFHAVRPRSPETGALPSGRRPARTHGEHLIDRRPACLEPEAGGV